MKIVEVREQSVSIRSEISNAYISFAEMTVSAAVIITDVVRDGRPVMGYGFNSNGRYSQSGIIRNRLIPRLMRAPAQDLLNDEGTNFDPFKAWQIMMSNEKPGGHGERCVGVGVLDMAFWDVVAKIEGQPLYQLLANWFRKGKSDTAVYVYGAGGYYYPGKELSGLQDEMRRYLDLGYDTVKMKIGGAPLEQDLKRIETVLHLVPSGRHLAVDANGRFDLATATRYARALEPYDLKWYEEPGDPLDFELNREVGFVSSTPIATGENLFSLQDARNLIRYGGMKHERDFLQMDPALSYGLVEYLRTLEMLAENGWSTRRCIPHGGHQFVLHIAAGLGLGGAESYPGIFEPFGGFADDIPVEQGRVRPSQTPGIGVEAKPELMKIYEQLSA